MNQKEKQVTDFTILGAGIAGLSIADELLSRGQSVLIIDTGLPGSGSSGAPYVLVNPATGRRAIMVKGVDAALMSISDLVKKVERFTGKSFSSNNGVLRPALTEKLAKDFKKSPQKYEWPDSSWIHWLDEKEFSSKYPYFGHTAGGLEIPYAFTVEAETYISGLSEYLQTKGAICKYNSRYQLKELPDHSFKIEFDTAPAYTSGAVIYATGSAMGTHDVWDFLPAKKTKGQLLDLTFKSSLSLKQSISSMGYFAFRPENPDRLVIGSTYEHVYEHLEPDEQGKQYLYKKLDRTLPGLSDREHITRMWAGERISMKDHQPAVGRHLNHPTRYILGGLGSKGMIQGRYLAKKLVDLILDNQPIDREISVERFKDK